MYRNLAIELADDGKLHIKEIADPLDLWEATRRFFKEKRPVKIGRRGFTYPETTNGEVRQLADLWTRVQRRVLRWDLARARQHVDEWKEARSQIEIATAGADPTATFPKNDDFWLRWTKRQAIYLSAVREMPTRWDMIVDSVHGSVTRLPSTLLHGAEAAVDAGVAGAEALGDAAASVAGKAVDIATAPARSLFGKLGTPLLIGAAVVGGVIVVPKLMAARRAPVIGGGS